MFCPNNCPNLKIQQGIYVCAIGAYLVTRFDDRCCPVVAELLNSVCPLEKDKKDGSIAGVLQQIQDQIYKLRVCPFCGSTSKGFHSPDCIMFSVAELLLKLEKLDNGF